MTVRRILEWAQTHNEEQDKHFPVMGVGYGCLAMMRSQMRNEFTLIETPPGGEF
jgi:hypothetical protein